MSFMEAAGRSQLILTAKSRIHVGVQHALAPSQEEMICSLTAVSAGEGNLELKGHMVWGKMTLGVTADPLISCISG